MANKTILVFLVGLFVFFSLFFVFRNKPTPAGDAVEYYGTAVSLIRHHQINLTSDDQKELEKRLSHAYFTDPQYYLSSPDGKRYPVHFFFYSILLIPSLLILALLKLDPILAFSLTNSAILMATLGYVVLKYIQSPTSRALLVGLAISSPIIFFLSWFGPDLLVICILFLSLFSYFKNRYISAALLIAIASWQSQPLAILAVLVLGYSIYQTWNNRHTETKINQQVMNALVIILVLSIPYIYNVMVFGALTPWTLIENGWTRLYGFGIQNIRLTKIWETLLDPNIGLLWYAPMAIILGLVGLFKKGKHDKKFFLLFFFFFVTSLFYETNPAWHYGTAGYGPGRHGLLFLPLFIYFAVEGIGAFNKKWAFLIILAVWQGYSLYFNGNLLPDFTRTLYHSPYAEIILNTHPSLYNPTPEIFVDRTNHEDLDHPNSAIYKNNDICVKAYILNTDVSKLVKECGFIPQNERYKLDTLSTSKPYEGIYINY